MEEVIFKILGILGLILITVGIIIKKRKNRDEVYILGGIFLLFYSIHIKDIIFILLQAIFIIVAVYDLIRKRKK